MEKKYLKVCSFFVFFLVLVSLIPFHQVKAQSHFQVGINGSVALPQGIFKDKVDSRGFGGGLDLLYSPRSSPFGIGTSMEYIVYGWDTRQEIIQTSTANFDVDVNTQNSIVRNHLLLRAQRKHEKLNPYLDVLIGYNYFFTDTSIDGDDYDEDDISTKNYSDFAFSYGAGFGFMYEVYYNPKDSKNFRFLVDLKMRYFKGNKAEYLRKGGISRVEGELFYDILRSETDLFNLQAGVIFEF